MVVDNVLDMRPNSIHSTRHWTHGPDIRIDERLGVSPEPMESSTDLEFPDHKVEDLEHALDSCVIEGLPCFLANLIDFG